VCSSSRTSKDLWQDTRLFFFPMLN
jgi:hypothetical protein